MDSQTLEATLGLAVRRRRIAAGLTREEVAAQANLSLGAVRHLETGEGSTVRTLVRVIQVLGAGEWLEDLAPQPTGFSPLAAAREAQRETVKLPRVRVARQAAP